MQYNNIESKIIPDAIVKIEFNRTSPLVLRYGSHPYGGLGLRKLETESLMKKILAIQSLMENPESSRLLIVAFHWHQHIYCALILAV